MTARARQAIQSREDDALAQLYQNVTEQRAVRFSAGYDLPAGRRRFTAWLQGQGTSAEGWDADGAVTELYSQHYRSLVRLTALLVRDVPAAEELVQDSFVALHSAWPGLSGPEDAVAYLRRSVIQGARAHLAAAAAGPGPGPQAAAGPFGESPVITALRALPDRQREAVVLRCCTGLADGQIAAIMGISTGAVRSRTARAMSTLRAALPAEDGALQIGQVEPG